IITASHWPTRRWAREGWTEGGGRQDPLDGEPSISLEALAPHAAGLVCLSGCARGGRPLSGGGGRRPAAARHLRPRPAPDRDAAPVLAARPAPQPAPRRAGRAAR